jgi:hypothetical protein
MPREALELLPASMLSLTPSTMMSGVDPTRVLIPGSEPLSLTSHSL